MTRFQILSEVNKSKPCGVAQIDRYLNKFGIEPLGIRQRPQQYPDDAPARILAALGIAPALPSHRRQRLASLETLRRAKKKAGAK